MRSESLLEFVLTKTFIEIFLNAVLIEFADEDPKYVIRHVADVALYFVKSNSKLTGSTESNQY